MKRCSVRPIGYGFWSFVKNMGKNIGQNISKSLNSKYS